ncbi:MAG TPA: glycoside hydrolase family 3 C-terminal domain-containing protein [Streptosporangiaceae bacterium]|nr:glycoside hydrolase family 3 C-terminal domain-containing protein [Streptosporangiaceae bacterium]
MTAHPAETGQAPAGAEQAPPGAEQAPGGTRHPDERSLLAALSLDGKIRLLTGADNWHTCGDDALGLRPMAFSDGPAGVRGTAMDERSPSSSLPCPSALGATWDPDLVARLAAALGAEARGKGVDVLLAPTVHLMRTPLGGRGFECFSEDPVLAARIAVAYVRGVQRSGIAAAVKHFVCNDSETGRWTYDARVAGNVLRELYLVPFEACVREAGAAAVMTGYNSVNGATMTENARLLRDILKREWGFSGPVLSDWHGTRSTEPTAMAGLDLAMPGPGGPWGGQLAAAVRSGRVPEEVIDDKVLRVLRLARRAGALRAPGSPAAPPVPGSPAATTRAASRAASPDGNAPDSSRPPARALRAPMLAGPALLREAAAAAFTLLRNENGALPLDPSAIRRLAVIGPNAAEPVTQGGGSAAVRQAAVSTPADALRAALAGQAEVTVTPGCVTWHAVPEPPPGTLRDPVTGEPGTRLEFRSAGGRVLEAQHRTAAMFTWWQGDLPDGVGWGGNGRIVLRARFRAAQDGPHLIGAGGVGRLTLTVDGSVVAGGRTPVPADPVAAMIRPGEIRSELPLRAGQDAGIEVSLLPESLPNGPIAIRLGVTPVPDEEAMLAGAVAAARDADAAVLVVGSAPGAESEGFDRTGLALPGRQDELIRRVAEANPRTIVVVNAGMPVLMPWAERAAAVGYAWLPGQAMGEALADVLLGRTEPGGRLPVTIPADERDCPVLHAVPADGKLTYGEGLFIGYRGYDRAGTSPRYPFGHGLGYTTWSYESLRPPAAGAGGSVRLAAGEDLELTAVVRNTGQRRGREVVQAYVAPPPGDDCRPVRALAAFGLVTAGPGEAAEVRLRIPARAFARWDEDAGRWAWPPGEFTVQAGRSSRDLRLSVRVTSG